jgi:ribosome biogenesis GTPase A
MDYQWYPGHMTKAKRMMEENIKLIDLVIEIIDARIPFSSRNPDIDSLAKNKSRIILLNKSDLADDSANQSWIDYYKSKGFYCLKINAKNGYGVKQVTPLINEACSEKIARDKAKGIQNRPIRAMIVGIPNVGKSTFINAFAGKACTKTGNKPGVTKGKQWIHINKNLELLDTPGILWPKFDDKLVGMRLAMIGSMNDQVINLEDLSFEILKFIKENYPSFIKARYELDENREILEIMDEIGRIRGCLKKGSVIDYEKLAGIIADDFRSGRLGRITLERP